LGYFANVQTVGTIYNVITVIMVSTLDWTR